MLKGQLEPAFYKKVFVKEKSIYKGYGRIYEGEKGVISLVIAALKEGQMMGLIQDHEVIPVKLQQMHFVSHKIVNRF